MFEEGELVGFLMKVSSKMQKWCSLREETSGRTVFDEPMIQTKMVRLRMPRREIVDNFAP